MKYHLKDTAEQYLLIKKHFEKRKTEAEELKMNSFGFCSISAMNFKFSQWTFQFMFITYVKFDSHAYDG